MENTFWYEQPPQKSDTAAQNAVIELPRTDTEKESVKEKKNEKKPLLGQFPSKGFFHFIIHSVHRMVLAVLISLMQVW